MRAIIIVLVFTSAQIFAKDFTVEDRRLKYKISYDEKSFSYRDEATEMSLIKKDCNAHIVERLKNKLDGYFKKPFLEDSRPEFLKILADGKVLYEPRYGERAVFFLKMPQEIKTLKIEESLNCKK